MSHLTLPLLELLKDVGRFVAETLSGEKLSDKAAARRNVLVQKLCIYLPDTFAPSPTPPPYLDMTATQPGGLTHLPPADGNEYVGADQPVFVEEEYEECHEPPPATAAPATTVQPREDTPPPIPHISYLELSRTSPKSAHLHRFERPGFFRGNLRQYWVGIIDHRLLFYGKERDSKPSFVLDIAGFQARPAPTLLPKDEKRKGSCLEVICPGKKTTQVQLLARTAKDMEQWVAAITQAGRVTVNQTESSTLRRRQLPSIPDHDTLESYDDIASGASKPTVDVAVAVEEVEEIYHDISVASDIDSERESIYDDIGSYSSSVYYNMGVETTVPPPKQVQEVNQQPQSHSFQDDPPEEMYDDISDIADSLAQTKKLNGQVVQGLAVNLEATLGRGRVPITDTSPSSQNEAPEEMYDDISDIADSRAQTKKLNGQVVQGLAVNLQATLGKGRVPIIDTSPSSQNEAPEEMYDDTSAFAETLSPPKKLNVPREFTGSKVQGLVLNLQSTLGRGKKSTVDASQPCLEEPAEEMYDDISSAMSENLSPFKRANLPRESSTGSKIQGLVLNLQATLGRGKRPMVPGFCPTMPLTSDELYEPVDSPQPKTHNRVPPQLPTKPTQFRGAKKK